MKNQKGITLVALIITIIVMVILAGVIIVSAVADGGIIDRAQGAMKENERAEAEELVLASYVYKTTASTTTVGTLDLNATADAIYENLTTNGFTLMDGNTQAGAGSDILEGDKINLNIVGKHGNYSGTVTDKGLENGLQEKEDNIIGNTNSSVIPEEPEKFTFTLGELANYQNDDPAPGWLESSRVSAIIMFPQTLSEELIFGTPHSTQNGYWINNITCSDSSIVDATFATSDPGPNFFQFVNKHETTYADSIPFYSARLIIYINGTMITSNNYQPYADLTFTITK